MREFKSGTLKSGGSGKKVTNPKQAIAIALSEANAMNQGGMMQNPVMQRPMFQTPMQRESMGIMAGVAPIRGYAEGGEAGPGIMDILKVAPGVIGDMVVGDDDTMADFFTMKKTPEGQGLNIRDLTDFFIVDPDDPTDVAIASATAGLMATGVGSPGAIAAQLGRMGYKGKKVADAVEKVVRLTVGETRGKTFGRGQGARFISEIPELFAEEEAVQMASGGIASLQPVEMFGGGLMTLLQRLGPSILKRIKKKDKPKEDKPKKESKKKEDKEPESPDMPITEGRTDKGSKIAGGIKGTIKQTPGALAGYYGSEFFRDPETGEIVEEKVEEASQPSQVITQTQTSGAGNQIEDTEEERGGVTDFLSRAVSKLQDPRLQYQLARAAQPSEGFTPRNFFSDVTLAGQEYDDMKAKRDYLAAQTRAQEDKTTDLERLADTFLSTVDLSGLSETQIQEEKEKILLSLYNTQQQSAKTAQLMELLSTLGTSEQALEALRKFTESGGSTESIADILSSIRARQQSI